MPPRPSTWESYSSQLCLIVLVFSATCVGCSRTGSPVAKVKGRVLLDGKPMSMGSVVTLPTAGRGAKAFIQHDGSFQLGTYAAADGALIGTHKAAVVAYEQPAHAGPESGNGKLLVPKKYINPESSGLTIEVPTGGITDVVLELSSAGDKNK